MTRPADDPAWTRLLAAARRSLERTGGSLDGAVSLAAPDDAERHLVIGITGVHRPAGTARVTLRLAEINTYLTQAYGQSLVDALGGGTLRSRPAEREAHARARDALLAQASYGRHHGESWYQAWVDELQRDGTITRLVRGGRDLAPAIRVLDALPAADEPMPVFAERLLGDTKALADPSLRTLLLRAIAGWQNIDVPANTEQAREAWESVGIIPDDLASQVLVLNLPAGGGIVGTWLTQAAAIGCPMRLTLHQLRLHPLDIQLDRIFVTENPAVLRAACAAYGPAAPAMVCTEGVPSAAAHRLLAQAASATLHWRNDFDWAGVRMTAAALARYPTARPWRMDADTYRSAAGSGQSLLGTPAATPWDPQLATAMTDSGRSVMEERVLPLLLRDVAHTAATGAAGHRLA